MRGNPKLQHPMFFVANTGERLPKYHPLRAIKRRAGEVLKEMRRAFEAAYSAQARPSIPQEGTADSRPASFCAPSKTTCTLRRTCSSRRSR